MVLQADTISQYGQSVGWSLCPRTVLVEGTTDAELFCLAERLVYTKTGIRLFSNGLTIVAAGERDRGGTQGVIRQLITLRSLAEASLMPNGRPKYRFMALLDNDHAGRLAINSAVALDKSIHEYRDVFRLRPIMPSSGNLDPKTLEKAFKSLNKDHRELEWELEDLIPQDFLEAFLNDYPDAVYRKKTRHNKTHREFTQDGKARLHRFVKDFATLDDLTAVVEVIKSLRFYFGLPKLSSH